MVKGGGQIRIMNHTERKHVKWANRGNIRRTDKSAKRNRLNDIHGNPAREKVKIGIQREIYVK